MICAGRVAVDGQPVDDPVSDWQPQGRVLTVDGQDWRWRERVYLLLHKPSGYECSRAPQHHASVFSLLPGPLLARGVQPVGRLDQDTTGLLLLSDDGAFIHRLAAPRHHVPKCYQIVTRYPVQPELLAQLQQGVLLRGELHPSVPLDVAVEGPCRLRLVIDEGKYHQVKRMIAAAGNRVERLHRMRLGGLTLGDLAEGDWRYLEEADLAALGYGLPEGSEAGQKKRQG